MKIEYDFIDWSDFPKVSQFDRWEMYVNRIEYKGKIIESGDILMYDNESEIEIETDGIRIDKFPIRVYCTDGEHYSLLKCTKVKKV